MKKFLVNLILWILFSLMQSDPIVATLQYGEPGGPMATFWLMVPFSLLCLVVVVITTGYAVPRLLIYRKWGPYAALEFCMSYILCLIQQFIIIYIWYEWKIIPTEHKLDWGWVPVSTLCNSVMMFFALLAVGGWYLFDSARSDLKREQKLTERIDSYVAAVRRMLRPEFLSRRLAEIADKVEESPQEAEKDINVMASQLRESLYNLPVPPGEDKIIAAGKTENRKFNLLLTSRRYHVLRVIIFQLSLIVISFGAFFTSPDQPQFGERLWGFLVLLAMFEIIAGLDIYVLFRRFRKKRRRERFILASGFLAVIMILPIVAERVLLYLAQPGNDVLFIFIMIFASLSSILMIVFYIAGIGAVLLYQDWVRHTRRLVSLQATTKRLEYANLRKQINPHFLFNILNSAGILTMFSASEARNILLELRRLIDYQFSETERSTASLIETISFLNAYLRLEATRRNVFRFSIACGNDLQGVEVPSLLFIPFVENAVKYADYKAEGEMVKVKFEIKGPRLIFECENPIVETPSMIGLSPSSRISGPESGGLGIANTLRRLDLLYEDDYSYMVRSDPGIYKVVLNIPLSRHRISDI